ncbi:helix-turn-helix transcriptional regulator [Paenibacillus sp. UMB4589-SE434]|uniref:helix-turn-helix transcriptional regulator n=1 Tax=Paenibacillus sp. UMB4589-SE434 TaxID=3046314 RepID=UPI00254DD7E8|nr:helix-turn-helix transcriptional regulator [Paenibacillus sp. UMB4589-SE434]MDK8179633.1 helix-turn-helix transcriptional regulator [Paenibacillus sp. UMB4589-SE434]
MDDHTGNTFCYESNNGMKSEGQKTALQAIHYMKQHMDQEITSKQLAAHVGYSPYHFTRVFKRETGISPRHFLTALRIESGKQHLLKGPSLMMKMLLSIGFRSTGSFHTRFKQHVGASPKHFRVTSSTLLTHMNQYQNQDILFESADDITTARVTCQIKAPPAFDGIIFVGLFTRPIPDQRPIAGTALNRGRRSCTFSEMPPGNYYVMAVSIPWSLNPKDYFLLGHCLRGLHKDMIEVTRTSNHSIILPLRERLDTDPPILVNLPLLLLEKTAQNRAK